MMRPKKLVWFATLAFMVGFVLALVGRAAADDIERPNGLMLGSIDMSIDPCTDFYAHACHGWLAANPVPPDESSWDVGSPLVERNDLILKSILESAAAAPKPDTQRIADYWTACMDETAIERAGLAPLSDLLDAIDRLSSRHDLPALLGRLHRVGVDVLFAFDSTQDFRDATQVTGELDQAGLGLPDRSYYVRSGAHAQRLRAAYAEHLIRMGKLAGLTHKEAERQAVAAFRLESAIARVSASDEERIDPHNTYHAVATDRLPTLAPSIAWPIYFQAVGAPAMASLNLVAPHFFSNLGPILTATSLDGIKAYLRLHLLDHAAEELPTPFGEESFRFFETTLRGTKARKPRWKRCVAAVDQDLGEELGREYVRVAFSADAKLRIETLVHSLRATYAQDLATLPWMSGPTRERALKKLNRMVEKVGYPDHWRDYSALAIRRDDALGNMFRSAEFELERDLAKIGKPVDRTEWAMTPPTVNAYYDDQKNDINFPAGNLQPPYFDPHWDDATNYGGIGATIGHEMTHGFDNSGRMFDEAGNLANWWAQDDVRKFETRAQCLIDEYDQFDAAPGVPVNGLTTLGENTADNGGTRIAYQALETAIADKRPGLISGYTPEQRYFLAFAQSFCENQTEASARLQAATDPHAPASARVNGVLQNMPEFRAAFACRVGQKMAPARMCRVW